MKKSADMQVLSCLLRLCGRGDPAVWDREGDAARNLAHFAL